MTSLELDQLLFGYRDGHQLLSGSRELDSRDLRLLLGATDMAIESSHERFLTGLPITSRGDYALCATWSAPEMPRPGAVWARVLLIPGELLGTLPEPLRLASVLTRPIGDMSSYKSTVGAPVARSSEESVKPPRYLLERAVAAAYGASRKHVVVESDLDVAELAIGALWSAQWPALRVEFTFRTRPTARLENPAADLVITREIRGTSRSAPTTESATWVELVVDAIEDSQHSTFHTFLTEFGPLERPRVGTVRVLANVFGCLGQGSTDAVRESLERNFPLPTEGSALKLALFGTGSDRPWSGSETDRIRSLLASEADAWDVEALSLSARVEALMVSQGPAAVSEALSEGSPSITQAVIHALKKRAEPTDVATFAPAHPELVVGLVRAAPELLHDDSAWSGLIGETARRLLATVKPDDAKALTAAMRAGFAHEVRMAVGPIPAATAIVSAGTYFDAVSTFVGEDASTLISASDDRVALLAVALGGGQQVRPDLPRRLERTRESVDEVWLRAAVEAIASPILDGSAVLPIAFGPLHNAITADQLPRECWSRLDDVLPSAPDPALRLRRYLMDVAEEEQWEGERFESALRGAGPHAGELLRDVSGEDDWWVAAARAVIQAAVGFFGGRR